MRIEKFEDIKAWQEARELAKMVYNSAKTNRNLNADYELRKQMQSAAVSVMSNIAEGFSRRSNKEFTQFLFIAKGSVAELQSQFYIALDQAYVTQERFDELYLKSDEVARLISGFLQYLLNNKVQLNKLNEPNKLNKLSGRGTRSDVKA